MVFDKIHLKGCWPFFVVPVPISDGHFIRCYFTEYQHCFTIVDQYNCFSYTSVPLVEYQTESTLLGSQGFMCSFT